MGNRRISRSCAFGAVFPNALIPDRFLWGLVAWLRRVELKLHNLRIGARVAMALALPLCGLFALSIWIVSGYYRSAQEMERLRALAEMAPAIRSLVHAVQLERGVSANYVGSAAAAVGDELAVRHGETDLRRAEFERRLNGLNVPGTGGSLEKRVAIAREKLLRMANWRADIIRRESSAQELTRYYGESVLALIGIVEELRLFSNNLEVNNTVSAYTRIMHAKELAGLERALGVAGFAAGRLERGSYGRFIQLIERQQVIADEYLLFASPSQIAFLENALARFDAGEFERMRQAVINSQGQVRSSGITAAQWFALASRKIDLLKSVEDEIDVELMDPPRRALVSAGRAVTRVGVLALALVVLTVLLAAALARGIIHPLIRITDSMNRLAARDESIRIDDDQRGDEIGDMARALIVFREHLIEIGHAEEKLKNEAILRVHHEALGAISQGVLIADAERRITYSNPAFQKITGYSQEEILGLTPAFLHNKGGDEEVLAQLRAALSSGVSFHGQLLNYRKDGTAFWSDLSINPVLDETGQPAYFVGVTRDITENRLMQQELRIAATAFESLHGVMVTDASGTILRVNNAFTEITGYASDDIIGKTPAILKSGRHSPEFYADMWQQLRANGAWYGEVWDRRKNGEIFPKWQTISAVRGVDERVTHYVAAFSDISETKAAENAIKNLAFYDPLTQLPNRRLLLDRLQHALATSARSKLNGALLFIDLDNFKNLNDTHGHDKGDLLLQQVAGRLSVCVREGDTVARLGGDEFVVMLEDLSGDLADAAAHVERVGEKILAALNQSYLLADLDYHSTPSIGATIFCGHATTIDDLLKQADLAMYQSKAAGRNALRFFRPDMQATVAARSALEADLRKGLRDGEFFLVYQPQVLAEDRLSGVEALVRWRHPEYGLVQPNAFIPLAEETGLILSLGQWVLETACQQLLAWSGKPATAHLTIAINVSARQFNAAGFVDQVVATLNATGADPQRLKMELTESLFLTNVNETIAKMHTLRDLGVRFSLDDFGTGYSSLAYLKRLPLDQLKIDQSFIRDVLTDTNDASIARTIVALGQNLGLGIIAEGVETQGQREFLAGNGCSAYQGYLFSKPLSIEELERQLGLS